MRVLKAVRGEDAGDAALVRAQNLTVDEHLPIVQGVARMLDRVVWVLTPRKIGDRDWVRMVHRVIKDARNVHCVLNKIDELMTDGESLAGGNGSAADDFWSRQRSWVAASLESAGCQDETASRFLSTSSIDFVRSSPKRPSSVRTKSALAPARSSPTSAPGAASSRRATNCAPTQRSSDLAPLRESTHRQKPSSSSR